MAMLQSPVVAVAVVLTRLAHDFAYSRRKHGINLAKHRKQGGKNHMSKLHFAIKRGKNTVQNVVLLLNGSI